MVSTNIAARDKKKNLLSISHPTNVTAADVVVKVLPLFFKVIEMMLLVNQVVVLVTLVFLMLSQLNSIQLPILKVLTQYTRKKFISQSVLVQVLPQVQKLILRHGMINQSILSMVNSKTTYQMQMSVLNT